MANATISRFDNDLDAQSPAADLVRVYLNGIGKTALLNAADEVELAKRIETGLYAQHLLDTRKRLGENRKRELAMIVRQMYHLDAVGVQALVVDQPFRQHQRLGWAVRLDVNLALEALETMAVRIQEILVEGDAVTVHLALRHPVEVLRSGVHVGQPLAIAKHDLAGTRKYQDALAAEL